MKVNRKALELVDLGLKPDTVAKLSESQVNTLYFKLIGEAVQTKTTTSYEIPSAEAERGVTLPAMSAGKKVTVQKTPTGVKVTPTEGEMREDQDISMTNATAGEISQDPHQVQNWDGTDDDTNPNSPAHKEEGQVESEIKEAKKKLGKKKSTKKNPWAICTAQMGEEFGTTERSEWTKPQMKKYERCVKDVKKSLKESTNSVNLFLEKKVMEIVEKHIPARMTKGDLLKYLNEDGPAVAPKEPKTKPKEPGTKPGTKPKKPGHPLKNPNPGEKPAPKANREDAKNEVIDLIVSILNK